MVLCLQFLSQLRVRFKRLGWAELFLERKKVLGGNIKLDFVFGFTLLMNMKEILSSL